MVNELTGAQINVLFPQFSTYAYFKGSAQPSPHGKLEFLLSTALENAGLYILHCGLKFVKLLNT